MSTELSSRLFSRMPFHTPDGEALLRKVEAHWTSKRPFGQIPSQADLAPEPLNTALSHCFVLERISATVARFRIAGKGLNELLRFEARGMPLSAIFSAEGRAQLGPMINAVCEQPEIAEIPLTASRGLIGGPLRGRLLLMPMKDARGEITRIFGALIVDGAPGRRALRFDIDPAVPLRNQRLATPVIRTIAEDAPTPAPPQVLNHLREIAPATIPAAAHIPTPRAPRSYLRLVVDNTSSVVRKT